MDLILKVKKNKATGHMFVNIPKWCGLEEGQEVKVDKNEEV